MPYSQKYCLVAFLTPQKVNTEFDMSEWPLHITLADVFSINRKETDIDEKLRTLLASWGAVTTTAQHEAVLGETPVVCVEKTDKLTKLHNHLIDLLESNGALFNNVEFTRKGFLPHCTIQESERLHNGDTISIKEIALIDMFPNGNWQQRKILSISKLSDNR